MPLERRFICRTLCAMIACSTLAHAADFALERSALMQLKALRSGEKATIAAFPVGGGESAPIRFERIDIYAPDARIYATDGKHTVEIARSDRIHLIGYSDDGSARVGLSMNADFSDPVGHGYGPSGAFSLVASNRGGELVLETVAPESLWPAGAAPQFQCGNTNENSLLAQSTALDLQTLAAPMSGATGTPNAVTAVRTATVAVDTDGELVTKRFGGDTLSENVWIGDLFTSMNVMYGRDLNVLLLQGSTTLRTDAATDPYAQTGTPANNADLNEFSNYWHTNNGSIVRAFAVLLSGKSSVGNSASGIATINAYCSTTSSYSVNQVFTGNFAVDLSARIVGHELGHNFGADHTHCTNTSGVSPSSSSTIDQCFAGEGGAGGRGCYSGPTSCPASGPGAPLGSIMSYCNNNSCGQNVLQFHPVQISVLNTLIASHIPACLQANDLIFRTGFN